MAGCSNLGMNPQPGKEKGMEGWTGDLDSGLRGEDDSSTNVKKQVSASG